MANSPLCTLSEFTNLLNVGNGDASVLIQSVSIDSRQCRSGSLFFALPGRFVDGHQYLKQAKHAGAVALVVSNEKKELWQGMDATIIAVPDPLQALQRLAAWHRRRCANTTVVAITGSNGKTSTKELAGAVISAAGACYVSQGNFNSEIGVALALCEMRKEHSYAVFEAGIDRIGEMVIIAEMLAPDIAVLTNIGHAHIGELGSKEMIIREKQKLFLQASCSIIPAGDWYADNFARTLLNDEINDDKREIITYALPEELKAVEYKGLDGIHLKTHRGSFHLPLIGEHNARNALAVLALAEKLDIAVPAIQRGMDTMQVVPGRGTIYCGAISLIGDWYNANPESIHAALQLLDRVASEGAAMRKIVVLGGVKELGSFSKDLHREIYEDVCAHNPDMLFLHGEEFASVPLKTSEHYFCKEKTELMHMVQSHVQDGDCILIKGSRAYGLEQLHEALKSTEERCIYAP